MSGDGSAAGGALTAAHRDRTWLVLIQHKLALVLGAGVAVVVAVACAATWTAPDTETSPIYPDGAWRQLYVVAVIASLPLYVLGAWLVRSRGARLAAVVAIAAAVQFAPLAAPLLYSTDAYSYWAYGRIGAVHGGNPYTDPPSDWPDDPAYALMGAQWHDTTSAYGPVWTATSEGVAVVAGESADRAAWLFKALAALATLGLVAAAALLARDRPFAAAFVGWNPVIALHMAGGGHNDALMMALPIVGMALVLLGRSFLGGALWPVGVGIKWLPLLFLPLVVARDRFRFPWRGFAVGSVVVLAVSVALYGLAWVGAAAPISSQLRRASSTSIPFYVEKYADVPQYRVTQLLAVLFFLAYLWLLREAWRGRTRLGLAAGLFCLSLSWLPPWYAVWPVSLAASEEDPAAQWLAVGLSAWLLRDAIPLP